MDILITGGTGFIGSLLVPTLTGTAEEPRDHVTLLTRFPSRVSAARRDLIEAGRLRVIGSLDELSRETRFDAVINLAGEGIADRPWTRQRKRELHSSRIMTTEALVDWLRLAKHKPEVLISGSAVGWYGNQGDLLLEESSPPHDEFVHELCRDWEQAALAASRLGIRVCVLRTGVVIGAGGGMLRRLLPVFTLGLGGALGSGSQYLSWISLPDVVQVILRLLCDREMSGVYNLTGPRPVTNQEFAQTLGQLLRRPAVLKVPASVIKLAMGEMSTLLLDGQRVIPSRLLQARHHFVHATLETALRAALSRPG